MVALRWRPGDLATYPNEMIIVARGGREGFGFV